MLKQQDTSKEKSEHNTFASFVLEKVIYLPLGKAQTPCHSTGAATGCPDQLPELIEPDECEAEGRFYVSQVWKVNMTSLSCSGIQT